MLKEKIKEATAKYNDLVQKRSALLKDANTASEVKDIKEIRSKITGLNTELDQAKADLDDLKELEKEEQRSVAPEVNEGPHHRGGGSSKDKLKIQKRAINTFIHTRDTTPAEEAGVKSGDASVTIPDATQYVPTEEIKTVPDLSQFITKFNVTTPTGRYPIFKHANSTMHTVEELAKNPDLGKPEFEKIDWKVDTYRAAIPLSQESIDDSAADLTGIVSTNAQETKINTSNAKIVEQFKTFNPATLNPANYIDDIKHIINVDLDWAYNKVIIASASFYNILDTMKDKNGHYVWEESWSNSGADVLKAVTVQQVPDELFGEKGTAQAFIGDAKRAVLMPNRLDTQLRWVNHDIYGLYLQVVARMGFAKADANAGYFVTAGTAGK